MTSEAKKDVRNWPRLTPYQRDNLADFGNTKYGEMYCSGRVLVTIQSLVWNGMLEPRGSNWFRITQRGRDYLRFGIRRKKVTP